MTIIKINISVYLLYNDDCRAIKLWKKVSNVSEEKTSYFSFGLRLFKRDADFLIEKNSVESSFRNYLVAMGHNLEEDTKEEPNPLKIEFESEIKREVKKFTNRKFDNIVFLAGAGASVVCKKSNATEKTEDNKNDIDSDCGKTVNMIAEEIYKKLDAESKSKKVYSLKDLAKEAHYAGVITEKNKEV